MSTHTQAESKSLSIPTPAMQPVSSGLLPDQETDELDRLLPSNDRSQSPSSPTPQPINPSIGHNFRSMAIGPTTSPMLQRKLAIGQPNDPHEQEADQVADQVMRMPAPKIQRLCPECKEELQRQPMAEEEKKEDEETLQTKPLAETITPLIQRQMEPTEEKKKQEEETLQTKPASGEASTASPALQNQITALQGGGQLLPESERHFFEPRFGTDFSQVRVHADNQAAEAARAVNARAFTLGRDVVFGAGEYQPRSNEGQRLLAHELTHVIQQQGQTQRPLTIGDDRNCYEAKADSNDNLTVSKPPISTLNKAVLQRQSVVLRSGRVVGIDPANNVREEVLQTMDRLHLLWSISNTDYDIEYPLVSALPAGSRVSATLIPRTIAAIRRNEEVTIHRDVVRHFLGLNFSNNVGRGQQNNKADILSLQTRLRALGFLTPTDFTSENSAVSALSTGQVAEGTIPRTLAALSRMKIAIAGGRTGWAPIHADEQEAGGDRFGGRTFEIGQFSVFIPHGVPPGINKIHIFFSPGDVQGESGFNAVLTHGLRGASDSSEWILIGVPGVEPGFVTISTTDIQTCLAGIGRSTSINSLRLSAHSRGYRGLRETIRTRLINTSLVERVVILDANYSSIASVLQSRGIPASRVIAYDVGTGRLPMAGSRTISLSPTCMRAIGYSRLIQDAMVTRPSLIIPPVIRSQLLTLPARGCFTTSTTPTGCQVNINEFCRRNRTQVNTIIRQEDHPTNGLKQFLDHNDLVRFSTTFPAGIYSHHFFVSEIAHEITD